MIDNWTRNDYTFTRFVINIFGLCSKIKIQKKFENDDNFSMKAKTSDTREIIFEYVIQT